MVTMFLLVLSGATIWGVTNILQRYFFRDRDVSVELMVVATMLGASVSALVLQFVLFGVPKVSPLFWQFLVIDALFNVALIFWENKSLEQEDASIVAPILGITPIFVILTSWIMLRESPTFWGFVGITVTVFGLYILALKRSDIGNLKSFVRPWSRLMQSRGVRFALLFAVVASVALNFAKLTVINSSPAMRTFAVFFVVAVAMLAWSVWRGHWQKLDKSLFIPLFGVGLLIGLSSVLMDWGFVFGIVPYVAALKRFQIIVTNGLAAIVLHERENWRFRITAAVIIVVGIFLIAF
ncbi:MAG TPA: DMT family transporter [Candidatus Paceibacterota bacterium]